VIEPLDCWIARQFGSEQRFICNYDKCNLAVLVQLTKKEVLRNFLLGSKDKKKSNSEAMNTEMNF
jgi:hypothetical protein